MNFVIGFALVKNIYVTDAKDETEAKQIANAMLLNILNRIEDNQDLIDNYMKIIVEKTGD